MGKAIAPIPHISASAAVYTQRCYFRGFLLGMDGVNDPTITVYDNASTASGDEIIPTNTYDASALGLNGVMFPGLGRICKNGIYIEITCAGTVEVTPLIS